MNYQSTEWCLIYLLGCSGVNFSTKTLTGIVQLLEKYLIKNLWEIHKASEMRKKQKNKNKLIIIIKQAFLKEVNIIRSVQVTVLDDVARVPTDHSEGKESKQTFSNEWSPYSFENHNSQLSLPCSSDDHGGLLHLSEVLPVAGFPWVASLTTEVVIIAPATSSILVWRIRASWVGVKQERTYSQAMCPNGPISYWMIMQSRGGLKEVPTSISHDGGPGLTKAHESLRSLWSEGKPRRQNTCRGGKRMTEVTSSRHWRSKTDKIVQLFF